MRLWFSADSFSKGRQLFNATQIQASNTMKAVIVLGAQRNLASFRPTRTKRTRGQLEMNLIEAGRWWELSLALSCTLVRMGAGQMGLGFTRIDDKGIIQHKPSRKSCVHEF